MLCFVLIVSSVACTSTRVGPTVPSGYFFTLTTPGTVLLNDVTAVVVFVYDAQGRPVDGIPVVLQVEPAQAIHAPIVPQPAVTQRGKAEVVLQPAQVGLVRITAVVEQTAQTVTIAVVRREIPAGA
jgi:hypothetical protein